MFLAEHRCLTAPGSDLIELYNGACSSFHVQSWTNRRDELILYRDAWRDGTVRERILEVFAPPRPGMSYDCRNGDVSSNITLQIRRATGFHLLSMYYVSILIENTEDRSRLYLPVWPGQGTVLGRNVVCAPATPVSLGTFVAWDTGTLRVCLVNNTGAFTAAPSVQLVANDAVVPFDASVRTPIANLGGPGGWRRLEAVLGSGGTAAVCPTVILGREYMVYFNNAEAVNQSISADIFIDPAGISR